MILNIAIMTLLVYLLVKLLLDATKRARLVRIGQFLVVPLVTLLLLYVINVVVRMVTLGTAS